MMDQDAITTNRLIIRPLQQADAPFIRELMNTEGWLQFIGNRNIKSMADAIAYINRIVNSQHHHYWTVFPQHTTQPAGIVTWIKRDYLPHHDIGFAFLPAFQKMGLAYEATAAILQKMGSCHSATTILATTLAENQLSIKLLKKLGFVFWKEIEVDHQMLDVYCISYPIKNNSSDRD